MNPLNLGKLIAILMTLIILIISIFQPTNLIHAVITMLMAIFLAIEDNKKINLHIHYHEKRDKSH
ncbi:hypothetical protein E4T80_09715 [Muribacter muris]|uniref:Uncharacterized protein n=1 Tax=Muribacter muris TaxID=67855 RepID=A0A4Y9JVM5_9PAST|nr:hypothetical protein [Muribacter muris]MBF0785734.1 hypothetical protein [Muribacter muris]MBF0828294.1 hypothetical protein [Muribacter muris]TFV08557.1 hypothetical protein E4T80_09715 [Muribacter muris]